MKTHEQAGQAVQYLRGKCFQKEVAYILDVDLRQYFDTIDHEHLREILSQRVGDGVIVRLLNKWLKRAFGRKAQCIIPKQVARKEA